MDSKVAEWDNPARMNNWLCSTSIQTDNESRGLVRVSSGNICIAVFQVDGGAVNKGSGNVLQEPGSRGLL